MEQTEIEKTESAVPEQENTEKPKKSFWLDDVMDLMETMLVSVFVVLLLFSYLLRPVTVDGNSMNPTLQNGDRLVMYRFMYEPKQGDIVVVDNYEGHVLNGDQVVNSGYSLNENIIKRVIAVEGQTIDIDFQTGGVYVDGEILEEDYINDLTVTDLGAFYYPITVPEGYIFVMGDNRNHSTDSRSPCVGLVSVDDVLGCTFFRYYPLNEIGFVN
jgi:signal peptidase I